MPVLINSKTGLAEDMPLQQATNAVAGNTHEVPLYDPAGNFVSAPAPDASNLLQQGYRQPNPDELGKALSYAHYKSPDQQLKSALEGVVQSATFGLSTAAERGMGVRPEDINARREINPMIHAAGQAGGLLLPTGILGLASKAGKMAEAALGGGLVTRAAVEGALLQGGDEISKMIAHDPEQSAETAAAHMGLAALVGGTLGGVGELWNATTGPKVTQFLNDFKTRVGQHLGDVPWAPSDAEPIKNLWRPGTPVMDTLKKVVQDEEVPQGAEFADKLLSKSLFDHLTGSVSTGLGGMAGHAAGIPIIGSMLGKKILGPAVESTMQAIMGPLMRQESNALALKHTLEYGFSVLKGAEALSKAAKNVFVPEASVLAPSFMPSEKNKGTIEGWLHTALTSPNQALNDVGTQMGYYSPENATAQGAIISRAFNALQASRPSTDRPAPFSPPRQPTSMEVAAHERTISLVEQPLMLLQHLKDGTITPQDVSTVSSVYPSLFNAMKTKVMGEAMNTHHKDPNNIPYRVKVGMSLLMGMPLESSTMPQNMLANHPPMPQVPPAPPKRSKAPGGGGTPPTNTQGQALKRLADGNMLPNQAREASKATGKA